MATDLKVTPDDRPGVLAEMAGALAAAGVNIDGFCAVASGGAGEIHVLVEEAAPAREAIEAAGMEVVGEQEVVVVSADDRPGMLADIATRVAAVGASVNLAYLATETRVVIGAEDLDAVRQAVG